MQTPPPRPRGRPAELGRSATSWGSAWSVMPTSRTSCYAATVSSRGMSAGGVVAIHSTIHPETCSRVAEHAARRGIGVIDAPVSGGGGAATRRTLLVMVGGDQDHLDRCRPVFDTFANPVIHLGPLGAGQLAKLVNNLVFTAQVTVSLETFIFADELGIDRTAMAEVLAHGSGGSRASAILAGSGFDTSGMRHAVANLQKDFRIVIDIVERAKPPNRLASSVLHNAPWRHLPTKTPTSDA